MISVPNLIQDPKPTSVDAWTRFGGTSSQVELRMTGDGKKIYVRNVTAADGRGVSHTMQLDAGRYVFGFYLQDCVSYNVGTRIMAIKAGDGYIADVRYDAKQKFYFTGFDSDGKTPVQLMLVLPPVAEGCAAAQYFLLCTAADYEIISHIYEQQGDLSAPWFDGDTGLTLSLGGGA